MRHIARHNRQKAYTKRTTYAGHALSRITARRFDNGCVEADEAPFDAVLDALSGHIRLAVRDFAWNARGFDDHAVAHEWIEFRRKFFGDTNQAHLRGVRRLPKRVSQ